MDRKELRQKVYGKYGGHCAYCGKKIAIEDMQIDHIKPAWHNETQAELDELFKINPHKLTKGTDDIENLNPSCRQCNFRKGTMELEDFRKELGLQAKRIIKSSFQVRQSLDYGLLEYHDKPVRFYFEKPLTFLEEVERPVTDLNKLKDRIDDLPSEYSCSQDTIIGCFSGAAHACLIEYYVNLDRFKKILEGMIEPYAYINCFEDYVLSTLQDCLAKAMIEIIKIAKKNNIIFNKHNMNAFSFGEKNDLMSDCFQIINEINDCKNNINLSTILNFEMELLDKLTDKYHIELYQFVNARIIYERLLNKNEK